MTMGMDPSAHLAYGYDLGSEDDFKAAERGEYNSPKLPWYDPESDDEDDSDPAGDFAEMAEKVLLESVGYTDEWDYAREKAAKEQLGVELAFSGHHDSPGWVLIATGSERSAEWSEAMVLDPFAMEREPVDEGWDGKLESALAVLGINPTQDGPKWLVFPSYG